MRKILFTTKACPNCQPAKSLLAPFSDIEVLDAHDNMGLVAEFGIRAVPTLIISDEKNTKIYIGIDDIKFYIQSIWKPKEILVFLFL